MLEEQSPTVTLSIKEPASNAPNSVRAVAPERKCGDVSEELTGGQPGTNRVPDATPTASYQYSAFSNAGNSSSEGTSGNFQSSTYPPNSFGTYSYTMPNSMPGSASTTPVTPAAPVRRERRGPGWVALIATGVVAALAGGVLGFTGAEVGARNITVHQSTSAASEPTVAPVVDTNGSTPDWEAVQKAVGDSVVAIDAQLGNGAAQGSGVVIDVDGHVLTNDHVISGANQIFVTLADGRVFEADLAGTDQATDLAVLTIKNPPTDLTVAALGTSSDLRVGQPVAAIGNPLGLSSTMTTGIISALNRPVTTQAENNQGPNSRLDELFGRRSNQPVTQVVTNAIQLDAAVNPGNSGGPVFDANGRVIGIASSIASISGAANSSGSIGLGFAIPIDMAKNISSQLIENGVAEHAFLGVTISDGTAQYDGQVRVGAEVQSVDSAAPAGRAGVEVGDIITQVNGLDVPSATALTGYVRQFNSGDVVTLTLERGGQLLDVDVTLATRQDQ